MRSPVLTIEGQITAEEGARCMGDNNINSLLVKENEDYVGIVTTTDLVNKLVAQGLDPKTTRISSIMSQPILTMDHYLPRSDAHVYMLRNKIKHLVVTKQGEIVGMLTTKDMIFGGEQDDSIC